MNSENSATSSFGEGDTTEDTAGEFNVRQKIAATARQAANKLKASTGEAVARAKDQAGRLASDKKEAAADRIGGYGSAIHESARALEEKDPNIAWFTHQAAEKLEHLADYVRGRDLSELRDDAAGLARRHPIAFFGGMFAIGVIVGNVVKASPQKARRKQSEGEASTDSSTEGMSAEPELSMREPNASTEWGGV